MNITEQRSVSMNLVMTNLVLSVYKNFTLKFSGLTYDGVMRVFVHIWLQHFETWNWSVVNLHIHLQGFVRFIWTDNVTSNNDKLQWNVWKKRMIRIILLFTKVFFCWRHYEEHQAGKLNDIEFQTEKRKVISQLILQHNLIYVFRCGRDTLV